MEDVSTELKAFLDYVAGKKPKDSFVEELEEAVKRARRNREWRHEYMTLLMRDQENIEKGREEGREKGREEGISETKKETAIKMLKSGKFTIEETAEYSGLAISEVEQLVELQMV